MAKETKRKIFENLCELINDYPMDQITVTLLVQKCDISRQTFYYHFSDIQSLMRWGIEQGTSACVKKALQAANMREATQIFFSMIDDGFDIISKMLNSSYCSYVNKLIKESILEYITKYTQAVKGEYFVNTPETKFILEFIANGITGEILTAMFTKRRLNIEETTDALNTLVFEKYISE